MENNRSFVTRTVRAGWSFIRETIDGRRKRPSSLNRSANFLFALSSLALVAKSCLFMKKGGTRGGIGTWNPLHAKGFLVSNSYFQALLSKGFPIPTFKHFSPRGISRIRRQFGIAARCGVDFKRRQCTNHNENLYRHLPPFLLLEKLMASSTVEPVNPQLFFYRSIGPSCFSFGDCLPR